MYHFTTPPLGPAVTLPSAIASANGPRAAAFSISNSDKLTANQLQNQVSQARRAREKMIDQVTKPPEPGWKSAMNQISDTVDHMEKVLNFLRTQVSRLPATPVTDKDALAVYPSGVAMQQSGRMPDGLPSVAEAPADLNATPAAAPTDATAETSAAARPPRVIYVMDDGVVIIGLPPADPPQANAAADRTATPAPSDASQPSQSGESMTSNTVISLPLTEDQRRASADLIALAQKAYAYQTQSRTSQSAELISDEGVGLTGALSEAPGSAAALDRPDRAPVPRVLTADAAPTQGAELRTPPSDPLIAAAEPYERNPQREAAEAQEQRQMLALQLDGHNDIIYIVPPAKAAIDLTA
ncbi:chemotaxis protein CheA [Tritonibacter mobilis]|uniref:chemotaxis protein CheA n=1 Tax=Tritonibacter mobilis TaxID=379347 RepID=UPI0014037207|nr:chemotaxis protein CheA [Tritonibacter mobilis]NHM21196.1 chemotaxis protein CheA [Tritonibacter mobilis]NHM25353.1 chemotaxis protein CheA [Tritonibacter mobilis]